MAQQFTKNDSRINKAGRPKGSKNKLVNELRQALKDVLFDEIEALPKYLDKLDDKERVDAVIKLSQFVLPKLNSVYEKTGEPVDLSADVY